MIALIYVSTAPRKLSTDELDAILATSRRNNERDGLTGMLLYADGNFIQVLEGDDATIDALTLRLKDDPRHRDITVVARYPIPERQFPEWSMAFRRMDGSDPKVLASAFVNLKNPLFREEAGSNSVAHRLLEGFRQTNRA